MANQYIPKKEVTTEILRFQPQILEPTYINNVNSNYRGGQNQVNSRIASLSKNTNLNISNNQKNIQLNQQFIQQQQQQFPPLSPPEYLDNQPLHHSNNNSHPNIQSHNTNNNQFPNLSTTPPLDQNYQYHQQQHHHHQQQQFPPQPFYHPINFPSSSSNSNNYQTFTSSTSPTTSPTCNYNVNTNSPPQQHLLYSSNNSVILDGSNDALSLNNSSSSYSLSPQLYSTPSSPPLNLGTLILNQFSHNHNPNIVNHNNNLNNNLNNNNNIHNINTHTYSNLSTPNLISLSSTNDILPTPSSTFSNVTSTTTTTTTTNSNHDETMAQSLISIASDDANLELIRKKLSKGFHGMITNLLPLCEEIDKLRGATKEKNDKMTELHERVNLVIKKIYKEKKNKLPFPVKTNEKKEYIDLRPRRKRKMNVKYKENEEDMQCQRCGVTESPEWRKGPDGCKSLCNACGLYYAKAKRKEKESALNQIQMQSASTNNTTGTPFTGHTSNSINIHNLINKSGGNVPAVTTSTTTTTKTTTGRTDLTNATPKSKQNDNSNNNNNQSSSGSESTCLIVLIVGAIGHVSYFYTDLFTNNVTISEMTSDQREELIQSTSKKHNIRPTIFVSMAAYRDKFCSDTLNYLFENAQHPENVFVGLVDQGSELLDQETTPKYPDWPNSHCYRGLNLPPELVKTNIRRVAMEIKDSAGPTKARYEASLLYRNETYYMQIDSHLRFIKHWDTYILSNHWSLRDLAPAGKNGIPRAILSHYPPPYEADTPGLPHDDQSQVPKLCKAVFNGRGLITFNAYTLRATKIPAESPFVAAGFFFGTGEFLETVPYDPHLPNMFEGEEILHTVRMYVNGYRFFAPTINICYHYYTRQGQPKFWEDNNKYWVDMQNSVDRAKYILGLNNTELDLSQAKYQDIDRYNIENKTLVSEYWKHYEIDFEKNEMNYQKWCD
ncbi:GlcNAc transferase [Heterostelium album PN500]|uniref:GlcNAc transferase n=1 Tax=Heterostelium pallidum (strain ATCC 26659 / Pp 5 / PN500) TaxID=670386 RepID=D3B9T6_HETP5|nr:GlcNAc transferase [Heterostelium album PN500]EFA81998.1 GlcNAc transferase [Heterostelium album PN500]|eukprot:XP_020434115.1 GlcNAc transferase [Heterostelium album PN500]